MANTAALTRNRQTAQTAQVAVSTTDLVAGETIVRLSDRGAPNYGTPTAPLYPVTIANTASLPAPPTGTPGPTTGGFAFDAYANVVLYWVAGTATHTGITVVLWAYTSHGDWVQVDTQANIAPVTEIVLNGAGYRYIVPQVSAVAGGATGSLTLYLAGA